ncbi:MAG: hypothetical protein GY705_21185 [Bacteroidetes bacterium]|nr:hypothetical protein [Bacteroidota bacterium]
MDYEEIIACKISAFSNYVITNKKGKKARLPMHMAGADEMVKFIKFKISQN